MKTSSLQLKVLLLMAVAIVMLIALQAVMNIGVTTMLLPNKGLPLPFISYGGSSLAFCLASIGILVSIYRRGFGERPDKEARGKQPPSLPVRARRPGLGRARRDDFAKKQAAENHRFDQPRQPDAFRDRQRRIVWVKANGRRRKRDHERA